MYERERWVMIWIYEGERWVMKGKLMRENFLSSQRDESASMVRPPGVLVRLHVRISRRPLILLQDSRFQPALQRDVGVLVRRVGAHALRRQPRQIDRDDIVRMPRDVRRLRLFIEDVVRRRDQLRHVEVGPAGVADRVKRANVGQGSSSGWWTW